MARAAKTGTVPFLLRLPPDLYAALREKAEAETRSINGEIVHLLRQWCMKDPSYAAHRGGAPQQEDAAGS
ncbi:MAG TPA: Arc family DNA-binding protein [Chloroflexota bacterium]|nr:Arc family DNA-binding protein [Chloroflexota bacterium]